MLNSKSRDLLLLLIFLFIGFLFNKIPVSSGDEDYYGLIYVPYFLFLSILLLYIFYKNIKCDLSFITVLSIFIFVRIPFGFTFLYLILTRYESGDLYTYFYSTISDEAQFDEGLGAQAIHNFHTVLFKILPHSLFGLQILTICISTIAFLYFYHLSGQFPFKAKKNIRIIIFFFIPSVVMSSAFIGKDCYALILTALIFKKMSAYFVGSKLKDLFFITCLILILGIVRSYQAVFFMMTAALYLIMRSGTFKGPIIALIFAISSWFVFIRLELINKIVWTLNLEELSLDGIVNSLSDIYSSGSHMASPYPFPFQLLQVFRPFPWECHNSLALFSSFENVVVLGIFFVMICLNFRLIINYINVEKMYHFILCYCFIW
ncbi:MAG: hypothetical protein C0412_21110, partial [Flavobacterium sp.]|nr:hypothetical protein [Flavobacterium sp.]